MEERRVQCEKVRAVLRSCVLRSCVHCWPCVAVPSVHEYSQTFFFSCLAVGYPSSNKHYHVDRNIKYTAVVVLFCPLSFFFCLSSFLPSFLPPVRLSRCVSRYQYVKFVSSQFTFVASFQYRRTRICLRTFERGSVQNWITSDQLRRISRSDRKCQKATTRRTMRVNRI